MLGLNISCPVIGRKLWHQISLLNVPVLWANCHGCCLFLITMITINRTQWQVHLTVEFGAKFLMICLQISPELCSFMCNFLAHCRAMLSTQPAWRNSWWSRLIAVRIWQYKWGLSIIWAQWICMLVFTEMICKIIYGYKRKKTSNFSSIQVWKLKLNPQNGCFVKLSTFSIGKNIRRAFLCKLGSQTNV